MPGGRVLMIAHHFPPAGGSGSNRALAFARHLPRYGWIPTVLTPGVAWATPRDDALLAEVPPSVRVVRTRSLEPRAGMTTRQSHVAPNTKSPGRLRAQLGHLKRFPDAHVGWLPFALAAARKEPFEVIYSSSGPFTSHVVALLLKRLTGKPWVAELRDGWYRWNRAIFPDYPVWRDALERRLEGVALRTADRVVLVTERMAEAFRCQHGELPRQRFVVVPNGFDPAQFSDELSTKHDGWEVVHAGSLYYGRSLTAFLQAAGRLIETDPEFARDFKLSLIGTLDTGASNDVQRSGLTRYVEQRGQLPHRSAIAAMRAADALLVIANTTPGAEATVPGKLFEYLAVGRPILAVAPTASSTADVLHQTGGGLLAAAGDPESIQCVLKRAYHRSVTPLNQEALARFDRRSVTGDLARVFDEV